MKAKRDITPAVKKNKEREKSQSVYDPSLFSSWWVWSDTAVTIFLS